MRSRVMKGRRTSSGPTKTSTQPLAYSSVHSSHGVFTVKTPWLLWTLLYASGWVLVFVGPEEVLLPFITRDRIGDDPRWFGFLLAVYGIGGVIGSIVVSSRPLPRRYLTVMN